MGALFLVHDLSPSRTWLHAIFNRNKELFAARGLVTGPFNPYACELLPSHCYLWTPLADNVQADPFIKSKFAEIAEASASGKDVLLYSHQPLAGGHKSFLRLLLAKTDIHKDDVNALFIVGKPLLSFEQLHREWSIYSEESAEIYIDAYAKMHELISFAKESYGNVKIVSNMRDDMRSVPSPDIAMAAFDFLGCEGQLHADTHVCQPLYYNSHMARRLCWQPEVRDNSWPHMDASGYAQTLFSLDGKWGIDVMSPLALRKKLNVASAQANGILEKECALAPGSLSGPQYLLECEESPYPELPEAEKAREFAKALPYNIKNTLLRRFSNDEKLLTPGQKISFSALCEDTPSGFRHIGEAEPPVELCVLTMTYNHEEYIEDCMKSVLAQRTDFPVRHIVLDHCSTDATASIISAYAEKYPSIRPVLLFQRRVEENIRGLFLRCSSRYAALCDGDDFFTDPMKLQKQVDYLEKNPQCALCFHHVNVVFEDGKSPFIFPPMEILPRREHSCYYLADLTKGNFIQTNSVVYRWRFRDGIPSWFRTDICPSDWYWHLLHAEKGEIGFLPDVMSTYRRHENALYATAFQSTEAHFQAHGMAELKTYQVCNEHFENRYFRNFSGLANGVFAAFFNIAHDTKNSTLLDEATRTFPEFAVEFYRYVNSLSKNLRNKNSRKQESNNE